MPMSPSSTTDSADGERPGAPGGDPPASAPSPRGLFALAIVAALLGLGITLSFGYADHDPRPHGVRIAVAGAPAVVTALRSGLRRAEPGGFEVIRVPGAREATQRVRRQSSAGALVVSVQGPVTVVTAGAGGTVQQQAITTALSRFAQRLGRPLRRLDVAPLSSGDHAGLSSFVFGLGLLIPSVIGGLGLFLAGRRLRIWWRVLAAALFALLVACGGVLALDPVLGALTGAGAALIGIGFLGALSFVLFVAALQAVVGVPGTGLAAVGFVFVGNAISGGSVPVAFLPGGFRQIAPWLPNNAIVSAARDVVYFHGGDLGHPLLVLGAWPVLALIVLAAVDLLHVSERRRRPHDAPAVYRTSALVHVRRRMRPVDASISTGSLHNRRNSSVCREKGSVW